MYDLHADPDYLKPAGKFKIKMITLYKKTSTGAIQQWRTWTEGNVIWTEFGQHGGKLQTTSDVIKTGKNIGKANETTPEEQAAAEALSNWEKKLKRGYVKNKKDAEAGNIDSDVIKGGVNPMLAQRFDKHSQKIKFPAVIQPKLDGHRCIAVVKDGKATLWSRTRKPITGVPHVIKDLEEQFPNENIIFDGELYNHEYRDKFEELTSFIRQETPKKGHEVVQYHIYDAVVDGTYRERLRKLTEAFQDIPPDTSLQLVLTAYVHFEDSIASNFNTVIDMGYEGLIVRNLEGPYAQKRSYDLQKVKEFQDAEFEIIGVIEGRGKLQGKGIFVCNTKEGEEFKCKMTGDIEDLTKYLEKPEDYIGKMLTVQFQDYTKSMVPRFAVGLRIREDI